MKRQAGQGMSKKDVDALLGFTSKVFRGLAEGMEKLVEKAEKPEKSQVAVKPKKVAAKKPRKKAVVKSVVRAKAKKKAPVKRKVVVPKAKKVKKVRKATVTDEVLKIIRRHKKGIDITKLKDKTGFADSRLRMIVSRAYKQGKIKRIATGVYVTA
jgi:hypothetical protein